MVDPRVEPTISALIENQFPLRYREEGELLVEFVRAYYQWAESSGQGLYHARRIPTYKDVDTTPDDFIVHFKEKYLSGFQLQTRSSVRQLIKHALDVYRTKGTDRSFDLFFRLVFDEEATVYRPSRDVFRLSSGKWVRPTYLELVARGVDLNQFRNYQIIGSISGARAFVEKVVRKRTPYSYVDLFYVSSVAGEFRSGEVINREYSPLPLDSCPILRGSLVELSVTDGSVGYSLGDIVDVVSPTGFGGKARVSSTANTQGVITATLLDGGFGYSANADVLISNTVITVADLTGGDGDYIPLFANVSQVVADVEVTYANGQFVPGQSVFAYSANVVAGQGVVVSANSTTARVSVVSGNVEGSTLYTTGNTQSADQTGYDDLSVHGRALGLKATYVAVANATGSYIPGETVYQPGGFSAQVVTDFAGNVSVSQVYGRVDPSVPLQGSQSHSNAWVQSVSTQVGLDQVSGQFFHGPLYRVQVDGNDAGSVSSFGGFATLPAAVSVYSLSDLETVDLQLELIGPYVGVSLSGEYPFPKLPTSNAATIIDDSLSNTSVEIGRINSIKLDQAGKGYSVGPVVRIYDPLTYPYDKRGFVAGITYNGAVFVRGETVSQESSGARGVVLAGSNSTYVRIQRTSFYGEFEATTGPSSQILGSITGSSANAQWVAGLQPNEMGLFRTGSDAVVNTAAIDAPGSVATLEVMDSGLGYVNASAVQFRGKGLNPGSALAGIDGHGTAAGFYKRKGGFLSDSFKLFDGDYYQDFSYEIRSPVVLSEYEAMVKRVLHPAGTKLFAQYRSNDDLQLRVSAQSDVKIG